MKQKYEEKMLSSIEKFYNPYLLHTEDFNTQEELFKAIKQWWIYRYRKKESTIQDRLRYAKKMSEHPLFPVNWLEFNPIQIIRYLDHREYVDYNNERGKHQIINEWKTIKTFAKAFGVNADLWGYTPPSPPQAKVKQIPLPPTVHSLIHHRYSTNNYENALVSHILTHSFHIGWRPSELVIQNIDDVFLEEGYLIITETKKYNRRRQIWPDNIIMMSKQKKSLKNYIECWRPQVVNEHSGNYMYLQKNGKPFSSSQQLSTYLRMYVGEFYPGFHPYLWRHWCAIARLIRSKIETKHWDIWM
jgi:integrase